MRVSRSSSAVIATVAIVLGVTVSSFAGGALVHRSDATVGPIARGTTTSLPVCLKGAVVAPRSTVNATCPAGWLPRRIVTTTYNMNASYSGTISILWNTSGPSSASINGKGTGTNFGFTAVSGSGTSTATAQSDPINGTGILSGKGITLHLKIATGSTATAVNGSAPSLVTIAGKATVTKGSGKFLGATGTLKISGAFNIQSTSGSEKDSYNATLKGAIQVKKTVK